MVTETLERRTEVVDGKGIVTTMTRKIIQPVFPDDKWLVDVPYVGLMSKTRLSGSEGKTIADIPLDNFRRLVTGPFKIPTLRDYVQAFNYGWKKTKSYFSSKKSKNDYWELCRSLAGSDGSLRHYVSITNTELEVKEKLPNRRYRVTVSENGEELGDLIVPTEGFVADFHEKYMIPRETMGIAEKFRLGNAFDYVKRLVDYNESTKDKTFWFFDSANPENTGMRAAEEPKVGDRRIIIFAIRALSEYGVMQIYGTNIYAIFLPSFHQPDAGVHVLRRK